MKIIALLLLLFAVSVTALSQKPDPYAIPPGASLQLTTEILRQTYCERENLRLDLRFTFLNTGSQTLILLKGYPVIGRYLVGKDLKSVTKGQFVSDVSPMLTGWLSSKLVKEKLSEEHLVILKPGETYSSEGEGHLFVGRGNDVDLKLRARRYFMRLQIITWYTDPALALEFSARLRDTGTLWFYDVVSLPMEFTIKPYDSRDTCDKL